MAGGDFTGVIAIVSLEIEAEAGGFTAGLGDGHAFERWDLDLCAVNGEAHGEDGGGEADEDEQHQDEEDAEEVRDGAVVHCGLIYCSESAGEQGWGTSGGCRLRVQGEW